MLVGGRNGSQDADPRARATPVVIADLFIVGSIFSPTS